jgi:hypothetical protein
VFPDSAELVERRQAGNNRMILHNDMASDANGIREDDVIAQLAIVSDVSVTKQ